MELQVAGVNACNVTVLYFRGFIYADILELWVLTLIGKVQYVLGLSVILFYL